MTALIKFITNEWYFFLPMLLMSLVAAALVVWRWLLNLNARTNLEDFLPVFQDKLQREGVERALASTVGPRAESSRGSSTRPGSRTPASDCRR